ncbi:hypothetical protein ACETK8_02720 [Brevundimonas staleyi]|uniref:Uncharacterized protein n=1 Tax=Brevundimonas staleyi TaxID=74326 RepID=A0ABW0FU60_9CAUL
MVERAGRAFGGGPLFAAAFAVVTAVTALGLTAAPAGSQVRPAPAPSTPEDDARAITQIVTAAQVADWARERRDGRAMIVAARMLEEVQSRREGEDAPFLTASALLTEAEAFAGDDRDLLDEISRLRAPGRKGVRASPFGAGPIVVVRRLRAHETYSFTIEPRRNEVLRVAAIGDGDTNIDLALKDQNGAVICADGSRDHYPVCTVSRPQGAPIRVEIVNRGEVWSRVQILTN